MPLPKRILIANRGTAATRIMRCCEKLAIPFVTVYSLEDCDSLHVNNESVNLGASKALDTYLNWELLFKICEERQCDAIHPGYGFLSENAEFARECEARGITFIGPTPEQISSFGLKHSARALAEKFDVPLLPGTGLLRDLDHAKTEAKRIGYPVLLKCVAGGGGIGMKVCNDEQDLATGFESVKRLAQNAFKDDGVFLEKFLPKARHVEVQIFGDGKGNVVTLGERDCSTQRRNQKVVEESPAPFLTEEVRSKLWASALRLAKGVGYRTAGTVEYVVDAKTLDFYFLEVNTRIQVEHGVTEQVYSDHDDKGFQLDLIEWMIRAVGGELDLSTPPTLTPRFHSIQCRVYAEDANKNYQPAAGGILTCAEFPSASSDVRVETWVRKGCKVSSMYDPMLAMLIVRGKTREEARSRLLEALSKTELAGGVETNVEFLEQILSSDIFTRFSNGRVHTNWLKDFEFRPKTIDVLDPGTQSSIQDYPGRIGYWAPGVPPSGPMDHLAFRVANRLVGNSEGAAGLEMTIQGATLKFNSDCLIALTGADMGGDIDGVTVKYWQTINVARGSVLRLRTCAVGCRTYLSVSGGGFQVPEFLGSKSTFALGKFGGHAGRTLVHGDVLHLSKKLDLTSLMNVAQQQVISPPRYQERWDMRVLMGPHSAPDFFKREFIQSSFFKSDFIVHYNSNRLGIRLSGPKPEFTRLDGGEAGLHPSNIHDTVYAIGTINFTGDMPVILGLDGPSLGGFVCPATVIKADLWKIGQLRPGDTVRFILTTYDSAVTAEKRLDTWIADEQYGQEELALDFEDVNVASASAILREFSASDGTKVVYRQAGDHNVLIEYGELVLDLQLRCRVHALMTFLERNPVKGIIELSPGVRSVQVHFDSQKFSSLSELLNLLEAAESELEDVHSMSIPSRIISLPLAFEASSTLTAISKYRQSVRDKAPWLPSNIEFIRRINGLESAEDVRRMVFDSSFLVLGLGDVYLGAPCAVPLDPRHRLLTTKYNPARTWTEEGEVGIGGVFMCIYGMQSPGGYQLIGRTVPIWDSFPRAGAEPSKKNWLLRSFDQVKFHLVTEDALMDCRARLARGESCPDMIRVEHSHFNVGEYLTFLSSNADDIATFQGKQRTAFEKERDSWTKDDDYSIKNDEKADEKHQVSKEEHVPTDGNAVRAQIAGNVWSVPVSVGDVVSRGDTVVVVEAMKLEINIPAPVSGRIHSIHTKPGSKCSHGDLLVVIVEESSSLAVSTPQVHLDDLTIDALHEMYFTKKVPISKVIASLQDKINSLNQAHPFVWITQRSKESVLDDCRRLDLALQSCSSVDALKARYPLFGIPFACKDNIDCKDLPTTCACPAFAYEPKENAFVVELLLEAGAILMGKTNMDQFAAGLVGARSPYGACRSVINPEYISGGSSSGSAVAVASKMVTFSLGTDTAGSGRVPAMYNELVGLKPSRGTVSARGVVPACKSLDCVSVFARTVDDAEQVFKVACSQRDMLDPYSKPVSFSPASSLKRQFTFGVPDKLEFFGDEEAKTSYHKACLRLKGMGGIQKTVPFHVFAKTAALLYQGPWVSERLEALEDFFLSDDKGGESRIHPVTWKIISGGTKYSAVDCFRAFHELESLRRLADEELAGMDFILCPTAPTHYKLEQVLADPIQLNSNLGIYTNFVNLLDLSAIAVPTGDSSVKNPRMPFGVTFIARSMDDLLLASLAKQFVKTKTVDLAVVGAHLSGMPLNHQLTSRQCDLVREAQTAKGKYKLFALNEVKPGLVRMDDNTVSTIAVEVWRFPSYDSFGSFVAEIPTPLGVGTVELDDGTTVLSFLCEQFAVTGTKDITSFGGWKAFKRDASKV